MKTCSNVDCKVELTDENCYRKSNGRLRSYCKTCHNAKATAANKISSKALHRKEKSNLRKREFRKDPNNIALVILKDSKRSDKKLSRENDLTKDFIQSLVVLGCFYCGETALRMTLDRKDNSLGHIQSNVVPSCVRCNLARGTMPYQAWLCLVPGLTEARLKGLFGDWQGRIKYNI